MRRFFHLSRRPLTPTLSPSDGEWEKWIGDCVPTHNFGIRPRRAAYQQGLNEARLFGSLPLGYPLAYGRGGRQRRRVLLGRRFRCRRARSGQPRSDRHRAGRPRGGPAERRRGNRRQPDEHAGHDLFQESRGPARPIGPFHRRLGWHQDRALRGVMGDWQTIQGSISSTR